jgi:hypothetical protein
MQYALPPHQPDHAWAETSDDMIVPDTVVPTHEDAPAHLIGDAASAT